MLICPRCKGDLGTISQDGIEVEECVDCHGLWLDANEISKLLRGVEDIPTVESSEDNESGMFCPKCDSKKLVAFIYDGDTGIELDSCPGCRGLWFDDKELKQIEFFVNMNKETGLIQNKVQSLQSEREIKDKQAVASAVESLERSARRRRSASLFSWFK